eukprot:m.145779 g.145779  ORF g.145779 m.145779 type:complete len:180 (+) comp15030_c0_seq3:204-743(+)
MVISKLGLICVALFVLLAWVLLLVCVADGPYVGWFKANNGSVRLGWLGLSTGCNSKGSDCTTTASYDDDVCFRSALRAAVAFTILSLVGASVLVAAAVCSAFARGPPMLRWGRLISFVCYGLAFFSFLAWVVAIGRVIDCSDDPKPSLDRSPAFLIVVSALFAIIGTLSLIGFLTPVAA